MHGKAERCTHMKNIMKNVPKCMPFRQNYTFSLHNLFMCDSYAQNTYEFEMFFMQKSYKKFNFHAKHFYLCRQGLG